MRVTMAVDLPECNSHIKKTFSALFLEFRKESERKIEEFEFESKFKKVKDLFERNINILN